MRGQTSSTGWTIGFVTLCTVLGAAPSPLTAQRPLESNARRVFSGVVVDGVSRVPIAGASVRMEHHSPGAITDDDGRFEITGFDAGPQVLMVRQFGYAPLTATVLPPELPDVLVELPLAPAPIMVEGVTAVIDRLQAVEGRLRSRRAAAAIGTRAFELEQLVRSPARDFAEFLSTEARIFPVGCLPGMSGTMCVVRRGRVTQSTVYIDEVPQFGGLDALSTYAPHELYLVEIYGRGTSIRAYTHGFIERMVERPTLLIPFIP